MQVGDIKYVLKLYIYRYSQIVKENPTSYSFRFLHFEKIKETDEGWVYRVEPPREGEITFWHKKKNLSKPRYIPPNVEDISLGDYVLVDRHTRKIEKIDL